MKVLANTSSCVIFYFIMVVCVGTIAQDNSNYSKMSGDGLVIKKINTTRNIYLISYTDVYGRLLDNKLLVERLFRHYPEPSIVKHLNDFKAKRNPLMSEPLTQLCASSISKDEAESSPFICAVLITKGIVDPEERAKAICSIISWINDILSDKQDPIILKKKKAIEVLSLLYDMAKELKNERVIEQVKVNLAQAYALAGEINKALEISRSLEKKQFKDISYYSVSISLVKNRRYKKALEIIKYSNNSKLEQVLLYEVACQYTETGKLKEALEIGNSISNVKWKIKILMQITDVVKYRLGEHTIKKTDLLCIASQYLDLYRSMSDHEIVKKELSVLFAQLYAKLEKYDLAIKLIDSINERSSKSLALHNVVNECIQNKHYNKGFNIALLNTDKYYKYTDVTTISLKYIDNRQKTKGLNILTQALEEINSIADSNTKEVILEEIAELLVKAKQYNRAFDIAKSITKAEYRDSALSIIAIFLSKTGNIKFANEVTNKINNRDYAVYSLISISDAFKKNGQDDKALSVISHALKVAQSAHDQHKNHLIVCVIVGYAEIGNYLKVFELIQSFEQFIWKVKALLAVSNSYINQSKDLKEQNRSYLRNIMNNTKIK